MNILISGGGTGGHIFPALAIANALKRRDKDNKILFVGANGRMEMERVPAAGYEIVGLTIAGFDRRRLWRNFAVLLKLWKAKRRARKIIRDFRPDIAVGVGGYASGPTLLAAQALGIPTLIQEQNSYAGVTNKHLGKKADRICVAYQGMERFFPANNIVMTGNPVRDAITSCTATRREAKQQLNLDPDLPLVLVVGGSLGARTINDSLKTALKPILDHGAQILWQTGKLYADECQAVANGIDRVVCTPFVSRMDLAYRAADIVVSRAGASTISELQLVGAPAILVPSPNVAEDHQRKNALALASRDAALMILDSDCRDSLAQTVISLLDDPDKRDLLSSNVSAMALPAADEKIVDQIYRLASPT